MAANPTTGDTYASGSGVASFPITPSDTALLACPVRQIWVGTAGDLTVVPLRAAPNVAAQVSGPVPVTYKNVPVGPFDLCVIQVMVTGTAAGNLVGNV